MMVYVWHRFIDALQDDAPCGDELAIGDVIKDDEHADGVVVAEEQSIAVLLETAAAVQPVIPANYL